LAVDLAESCFQIYNQSITGVAAEISSFQEGIISASIPQYHLRPEAVESFYYLWKHTGDIKWREYGWTIFQSIEKWCKVDSGGYAALQSVTTGEKLDEMESFWMVQSHSVALCRQSIRD